MFFSSGAYGLKVIERARRRAAASAWNVPQVCTAVGPSTVDSKCETVTNHYISGYQMPDNEPRPINIRVTTEMENELGWGRPNENGSETSSGELACTLKA